MPDVIDLQPACSQVFRLGAQATAAQLDGPTPCGDWTVRDVIAHLIVVAEGSFALARRDRDGVLAAQAPGGSGLFRSGGTSAEAGPDRKVELARSMIALHQAWSEPTAWEGEGVVPGLDLSNETWGKIALTEVVVHGWDLAVATGNGFSLPDATLAACWEHVSTFVPGAPVPGLWGPATAVADGAPLIDRIVAVTGRTPVDLPPARFD